MTPGAIAELLEILNDGEWHTAQDLKSRMKLNRNQIRQIAEFLFEYQFIEVDATQDRLKLRDTARRFLSQTATS